MSYRSRSVSDFPGARPYPATVETDWYRLAANAKNPRAVQGSGFVKTDTVVQTEAGSAFNNKRHKCVCTVREAAVNLNGLFEMKKMP